MARNKYDFILELLEYKKLNPAQKERILKLSAQEIKNENIKDEELLKRIEGIEQLVKLYASQANDKFDNSPPPTNLPKYIDPKNLYTFLKDFNTDPILKTTCHEIDRNELENICGICGIKEYDFERHRQMVQERFAELVNDKKYFVDYKIKNLIYVYLTGQTFKGEKGGWTDDKIPINWNTEMLSTWCSDNKNKIPHPDCGLCDNQGGIEFKIRPSIHTKVLGKKKLTSFSDVVLHFKYLFHLRAEKPLFDILEKINQESENWKNKVRFELDKANFHTNFEFFTNVEKLIQAYKILINLIIDIADKNRLDIPVVKLSLTELPDGMNFSIHHKNSVFRKSIQNTIDRDGLSLGNLIKHQINGLCDLYVNADFGDDQYAEINIWDGNPRISKPLHSFQGVEYVMKFKK